MATLARAHPGIARRSYGEYRLLVGVGLALLGLNLLAPASLTHTERALASGVLALAATPTWRFIRRRESGVPFLPLFGAVYAIHYALPVFLLPSFGFRGWFFPEAALEESLLLSFAGLALLLVAFYSLPGMSRGGLIPRLGIGWSPTRVRWAAPPIAFVGLAFTYARQVLSIPLILQQVVDFLCLLSLLGILMLFILQLQGRLDRPRILLLWGALLPGQLMLDLATGAVYQVLKDLLPMLMIYWSMRRRVPWKLLALGLLVLVLLRGNQAAFRTISRSAVQPFSVPERSLLYVDLVVSSLRSGRIAEAYAVTLERTSHLTTFADVVEQTPALVPYWGGETYRTLLTSPIPRLLWPDKPTKTMGQAFGHRYGRLAPEDEASSENLPQLVEMYANFGWLGVLAGMFLLGAVYRALDRLINHARAGEGGLLISAVMFSSLLSIESDLSLVFGAVLQQVALFYLLLKPLRARGGHAGAPGGRRLVHARHGLHDRPLPRL